MTEESPERGPAPALLSVEEAVRVAVTAIDERKGEGIAVLRMVEVLPITDYFLIATGRNQRHVDALAELVEKRLKERKFRLQHASGRETMNWVLLDYGPIVVHLFQPTAREFYDLETRWADAERVDLASLPQVAPLPAK